MAVFKINNVEVKVPDSLSVTVMDIDDGQTSVRSTDGTLNRDRITVKRQVQAEWGMLKWTEMSAIMQAMADKFFTVYYPDPMTGAFETKTFYVGNRPAPVMTVFDGSVYWESLKVTLTER